MVYLQLIKGFKFDLIKKEVNKLYGCEFRLKK